MGEKNVDFDELINGIAPTLLSNIIYKDDTGYVLYEKYHIIKKNGLYMVIRNTDDKVVYFSKLRHAASWAILDRYNKIPEAKRVLELEQRIFSIAAERLIHKSLQGKGPLEHREINRDKYLVDLDKQKKFQMELDKYIILAKKCQDKGYENELTRTARK